MVKLLNILQEITIKSFKLDPDEIYDGIVELWNRSVSPRIGLVRVLRTDLGFKGNMNFDLLSFIRKLDQQSLFKINTFLQQYRKLQEIEIKQGPTWEEVYKLYHEIMDPIDGSIKSFEIKEKVFNYLKQRINTKYQYWDLTSLLQAIDKKHLVELYKYLKKQK